MQVQIQIHTQILLIVMMNSLDLWTLGKGRDLVDILLPCTDKHDNRLPIVPWIC
jgi:hypothetical protein